MGEVHNGDQKVRKYLFPEMFDGRQEVHKYFVLLLIFMVGSRSIHYSSFASHKKKATDRPTVAAPKCQRSEDEPPIIKPVKKRFL